MPDEKRDSPRIPANLKVEMTDPKKGTVLTKTRDISDRGAFVLTDEETCPELRARIKLRVLGLPGESPEPVESEVVRIETEGVGVKFLLEHNPPAQATEEEEDDYDPFAD